MGGVYGDQLEGGTYGLFNGAFLTPLQLGILTGEVWGLFDDGSSGTWLAESVGVFAGLALPFSGLWGSDEEDDYTSLYYNNSGNFQWAGEDYGLIGGVVSPWNAPAAFLAMGEYFVEGTSPPEDYEKLLWNSSFRSHNHLLNDESTPDGGSFFGFSAGLWRNNFLEGSVSAFYIDPTGKIGVLSGSADGFYDPTFCMWLVEGTLTASQQGAHEQINAANFSEWVESIQLHGMFSGHFSNDTGYISAEEFDSGSKIYFLEAYNEYGHTPNFGLFNFRFSGGNYSYSNPGGYDQWSASMGDRDTTFGYRDNGGEDDNGYWVASASGYWYDNGFSGIIAGDYLTRHQMGSLQGEFSGLYFTSEEYNTIIGQGLGTFTGDPIKFNGDWGYADRSLYGLSDE